MTTSATLAGLELPADVAGQPVTWTPWERHPHVTHLPWECPACGATDGGAWSPGWVEHSWGRHGRYSASGCLRCGAVEVIDLHPGVAGRGGVVWTNRGQGVLPL